MSGESEFRVAWAARFPVDPPPQLECYNINSGQPDLTRVESEYKLYKERSERLQKEAEQQTFIASYLWDILHSQKPPQLSLRIQPRPETDVDLDSPIPIEGRGSKRFTQSQQREALPPYMETDLDIEVGPPPDSAGTTSSSAVDTSILRTQNHYHPEPVKKDCGSSGSYSTNKLPGHAPVDKDTSVALSNQSLANSAAGRSDNRRNRNFAPAVNVNANKTDTPEQVPASGDRPAFSVKTAIVGGLDADQNVPDVKIYRKYSADNIALPGLSSNSKPREAADRERRSVTAGLINVKSQTQNGVTEEKDQGLMTTTFTTFKPRPSLKDTKSKSVDVSEEGESRPVPAPRPSVKGPQLRGRGASHSMDAATPSPVSSPTTVTFPVTLKHVDVSRESSSAAAGTNPVQGDIGDVKTSSTGRKSHGGSKKGPPVPNKRQSSARQTFDNYENVDIIQGKPKIVNTKDQEHQSGTPPLISRKPGVASGDNSGSPSHSPRVSRKNSRDPAPQPSPKPTREAPTSVALDTSIPFNRAGIRGSGQKSVKQNPVPEEPIYEDPIAVRKELVPEAEDSSSDEEPQYYNLMNMIKQQSLGRGHTLTSGIYASVDIQKRNLEKQAQRLSRRFSASVDPAVMSRLPHHPGLVVIDEVRRDPLSSQSSGRGTDRGRY